MVRVPPSACQTQGEFRGPVAPGNRRDPREGGPPRLQRGGREEDLRPDRRDRRAAEPLRQLPDRRVLEQSRCQGARRDHARQRVWSRRGADPHPFRMPDRGWARIAALRLPRPARGRAAPDRPGGLRAGAVPEAGRPRDRPAQQDSRLRAPGPRARHRRRQPGAGLPRR